MEVYEIINLLRKGEAVLPNYETMTDWTGIHTLKHETSDEMK